MIRSFESTRIASLVENIERMKTRCLSECPDQAADTALAFAELQLRRMLNRLAPIYLLPPEILSIIFEIGQALDLVDLEDFDDASSEDSESSSSSSQRPFEISMTHISSYFRDVAISTCKLWTTIRITHTRPIVEEITTYLSRSDGCGLRVRMDLTGVDIPSTLTIATIGMVLPQSHRCYQLAIDTFYETQANPIIAHLNDTNAPLLEHLSISVDNAEGITVVNSGVLRGGAPKLSFVRLRGLAMSLFPPPLENVTTLHLDQTRALPIRYNTFRQMITASPFLENLSVYGDIINTPIWPVNRPVEMPYLRCLRICGVDGAIYSGLLLCLDAPNLESLVLKNVQERDLEQFWASPDKLKFPCIQNLTFSGFEVSSNAYEHFFRAFPAVSMFTTTHYANTPKILLELAKRAADDVPWPDLHNLTFLLTLEDASLMEEVVQKRIDVGCPLSTLRMGTTQPLLVLQQYEWLCQNVNVEVFHRFDQWPTPNSNIFDPDDYLFDM